MKENHPVVLGQSHASADVSSFRKSAEKVRNWVQGPAASFPGELKAGLSDGRKERQGLCAEGC